MIFYTNSNISIPANGDYLVVKKPGKAAEKIAAQHGEYIVSSGSEPCTCFFQELDSSGSVISSGEFEIRQDLANASADFDPRSTAEITLEALEDKIAGRALTIQQSKISVGDRSIEYMNSIDELLRWRDYFRRLVAKEKGQSVPKMQSCKLRRNI